jgi:hypothetical protein
MRKTFAFSLALSCLVSGCGSAQQTPAPPPPMIIRAEDALAVSSRVTDCEWKAVGLYDDGHRPVAELARQIMGVCAVELTQAEIAFHLLNDPDVATDEFNQAVEVVDDVRKTKIGRK